jgi:hypothetical protein
MGILADQWRTALARLVVRHPNGFSTPIIRVHYGNPPVLHVGLDVAQCTATRERILDFTVSNVKLSFFPGTDLARAWLAAAWVGYLQHEALELVTIDDFQTKVLDPHAEPYAANPVNRGLREGFPLELTHSTMVKTLALVMGWYEAERYAKEKGRDPEDPSPMCGTCKACGHTLDEYGGCPDL